MLGLEKPSQNPKKGPKVALKTAPIIISDTPTNQYNTYKQAKQRI